MLVEGLSACVPGTTSPLTLDPARPLTLLVHGCNASLGEFRSLSAVFEAHGQQTLCFVYDDRDRIEDSSAQLIAALTPLEDLLEPGELTLLGHSQGGLVCRRALVADRPDAHRPRAGFRYRLVTVSSPFAGIRASHLCGKTWLHVITLGVTMATCQAVTGSKWPEIFPGSKYLQQPGRLGEATRRSVQVVTDERGACLERARDGSCAVSDDVFSLEEQQNPAVEADARVQSVQLRAGHSAVVGIQGEPPNALIEALQTHGVLAQTPTDQKEQLADLLAALYGSTGRR